MRRVVCRAFGPVEQLEVEEAPDPVPGVGQVLLEVAAAGVNHVDALFVEGAYQIKPPLPFTPGSDLAGRVAAVGEGVDPRLVGRSVLATAWLGAYATHAVVPVGAVADVPPGVDLAAAACLVQSHCTMLRALRKAALRPGEWVLQLGAGGGLGLAGTALATALGGRVVAVASSPDKRAAALAAGAEVAVDPGAEDVKARVREVTGGGADVALDPVGGELAEVALRCLGWGGRLVVLGFLGGIPRLPANQVLLNDRSVVGVDWGAWTVRDPEGQRALLDELLGMLADGTVAAPRPVSFPLEEAAAALRGLQDRRLGGKAALVPTPG